MLNISTLHSDLTQAPRSGRVVLFGELLADVFPDREVIGGAPFNVARHLTAFGTQARLISRIGRDAVGEKLLALLERFKMDTSGIQRDPIHPTGQVRVHLNECGHRFEILPDQAYDHIDAESAKYAAVSAEPSLIYFGTLTQRHAVSRVALQTLLRSVNALRMLDLNLRVPWFDALTIRVSLDAADIVKLNAEELVTIAHLLGLPGATPQEHAESLMSRFSIQTLLLTEGAQGAWLLDSDGTLVKTERKQDSTVVDSVGAGDAFSAVFIVGFFSAWSFPLMLERADAFARAICGIQGAVPLDDRFYASFLEAWHAK